MVCSVALVAGRGDCHWSFRRGLLPPVSQLRIRGDLLAHFTRRACRQPDGCFGAPGERARKTFGRGSVLVDGERPVASHLPSYAERIRAFARLRALVAAGRELVELGTTPTSDVEAVLDEAERLVLQATSTGRESDGRR